jgi:hypothetical protein
MRAGHPLTWWTSSGRGIVSQKISWVLCTGKLEVDVRLLMHTASGYFLSCDRKHVFQVPSLLGSLLFLANKFCLRTSHLTV